MPKMLEVYYKGKLVGALAETPDKLIAFQYSEQWLKSGFSISPLSLPLKDRVFIPKETARERFHGLFGVFADSLPDSWGELLLDRYLKTIGITSVSTLERLAFVGSSGMGALEYVPAKHVEFSFNGMDYDKIAQECENVLLSRPTDMIDSLFGIGGSGGGTRPKILITDKGRDWIIKFPAANDPGISGKREYDYSVCAKKAGISMTDTELLPSGLCDGYFKTERFDRCSGEKVFSITFAGLLETDFRAPSCDYNTYMKLVNMLTRENRSDLEQIYRTMCFNVIAHNRDDHAKNFSFLFTESAGWRLAPSYDLTYSDTYFGEQTTSVNGKGKEIRDEDLVSVGAAAGINKNACVEMLEDVRQNTAELAHYIGGAPPKRTHAIDVDRLLKDLDSQIS